MSNRLIRCDRCGGLYNPDWKCACPIMCTPKPINERYHTGTKQYIKPNGYGSSLLLLCDTCGTGYDPTWQDLCPGRKTPLKTNTVESLAEKVKDLESRIIELERMHRIYGT